MWATINNSNNNNNNNKNANRLMSSLSMLSFNNKSMSTSNVSDDPLKGGGGGGGEGVGVGMNSVIENNATSPFLVRRRREAIDDTKKSISNASSISMRILRQIDPTYNSINSGINGI